MPMNAIQSKWQTRRSPRLTDYDYSREGAYFVTVCAQNMRCLFGKSGVEEIQLNPAGQMLVHFWQELAPKFPMVELDSFVVMPNHFHGLVVFTQSHEIELPTVIQWFKTMTTNHYIRGVKTNNWKRFNGTLWQRSYYDTIIRDEAMLYQKRKYILDNPAKWLDDEFYRRD